MASNKIGKTCPSKLETTIIEINGVASVQVKYWKTHCGHAQEIDRLKIDKENRAMIAGSLFIYMYKSYTELLNNNIDVCRFYG